jgi:hypothetical protein
MARVERAILEINQRISANGIPIAKNTIISILIPDMFPQAVDRDADSCPLDPLRHPVCLHLAGSVN